MRERIIKWFCTRDIEKMADDRLKAKLHDLLTIVDEHMVVTFSERMKAVFIGGERADDATLRNLKSEAEFFLSSNMWKIIHETPKQLAHKAMFVAGESVNDMVKGRAMLYTLDTQKRILETLSAYTQPPSKGS